MLSLSKIETDLTASIKAKDQLRMDTLRGLKTAVHNEQIAKMKDLSEEEIAVIVKRELKRRKEAATAFQSGNRQEMADKELKEAAILESYLPQQMSEEQIKAVISQVLVDGNFSAKDFGPLMSKLRAQVGPAADGATLAKLLKERLK